MPVNDNPHSSWAEVYDLAYERAFGVIYNRLTVATVDVITSRVSSGGRIVDFGAGTGRLSIPLAEKGFEVTAVDPCREMLFQLEQKKTEGMKVRTVCSKMQDFREGNFDFALCVFTVLSYLLDEDSLKKALLATHRALKSNGSLLIDIPARTIFQSYSWKDDSIERSVSVIKENADIYRYQEKTEVKRPNGGKSIFSDEFKIRHWPSAYVLSALLTTGFVLEEDLSDSFSYAGSQYWILKKA